MGQARSGGRLSRRSMLVGLAASAATVWFGAAADSPKTGVSAVPYAVGPVAGPVGRPPLPVPVPSAGAPLSAGMAPVRTLADYRKAVPGSAFPGNAVALTIDDGPHPVWTPKILDLLEHYHVQATFCLIGNQVLGHEDVARSVAAAGHHLANHSYHHYTALPRLPADRIRQEIEWAQDKIFTITGYTPRLFRAPGGGSSPLLESMIAQAGLIPFDWSEDPRDWTRPGTPTITERMLSARPGQILLCHDGGGDRSQTYAALQTVIPALQARGYVFVCL